MNSLFSKTIFSAIVAVIFLQPPARAQFLDQIGVTALRAVTTNVNGAGIRVAQPEGQVAISPPTFEINPANVGQPPGRFNYLSADGATNVYPNSLGANSWHADGVGQIFFGRPGGIATNVAQVNNYDADFYVTNYVFNLAPALGEPVVNQSYTFGVLTVGDQEFVDSAYDDYAETFGTLFVSAVDNGGNVHAPGTAYNCIAVAAYGGASSIGPTVDNGRCKPDLTAPSAATSYSTPEVSGSVVLLMQAALRGDGGSDTNSAFDMRTIKALLLNGAVKPLGWTNGNSTPLDARYGAGVVNVLNAYEQLAGGKNGPTVATNVPLGGAHPPVAGTNFIAALSGWDFNTNATTATNDCVNHYFFNVTNGIGTATLGWNRQLGATNINDLDLFLFNAANSNLVACSTSRVDNVEHIYLPSLAAGRYDLQVLKHGGTNAVSDAETYALAWEFISPTLQLAKSGANAAVTWPVYPAGFLVEARTNLLGGAWSTNNLPAFVITNDQNRIALNPTNSAQFFRLRRPNF